MIFDDHSDDTLATDFDHARSSIRHALERLSEAFSHDGKGASPSELQRLLAGFEPGAEKVRLGRFTLIARLGEGTFSSVYLAQDELLEREVTLKIPKPEVLLSKSLLTRFFNEARVVSRLHHPNIVPVLDARADGFEFFIAREYCEGPDLAKWLRDRRAPLEPRVAAEIVARLAEAVQHANDRGVLHRDIKPANVLLQRRGDESGTFPYAVLLSDFGLAKCFGRPSSEETTKGTVLGTRRYMAPEQARGNVEIGSAAEVYSLGVTLYELLTLTVPFASEDHVKLMAMISETIPVPVRKRNREVPRDLEAITMKCLEKLPENRYATPSDLAADLNHYLRAEPVAARRWGPGRTFWLWAYRHPAMAAIVATVVIAAAVVYATLLNRDARVRTANESLKRSLVKAEMNRRNAQRLAYASDMRLAGKALADGDVRQLRSLVERYRTNAGSDDLRGFEWHVLDRAVDLNYRELKDSFGPVNCVRHSNDGRWVATCGGDGFLRVYDAKSLQNRVVRFVEMGDVGSLAFSPDSTAIVTTHNDGRVSIRSIETGDEVRRIEAHVGRVTTLAFSPDGASLFTAGEDTAIRVWDFESGELSGELEGHHQTIDAIAIAANGKILASVSRDRTLRLWDVGDPSAMKQHDVIGAMYRFTSVGLSPDAKLLSAGTLHEGAFGRRVDDHSVIFVSKHLDPVDAIAFDPTGRWAADADRAGVIRFWPLDTSVNPPWVENAVRPISWCGHDDKIRSISFSADGNSLATASNDGVVRIWSVIDLIKANAAPLGGGNPTRQIAQLDQETFVTADAGLPSAIRTWDYQTKAQWKRIEMSEPINSMVATPDGSSLFVGYLSGALECLDAKNFAPRARIETIKSEILEIVISGDGRLLCAWTDQGLHWHELPSLVPVDGLPDRRCNAIAMSGDGRWFALGTKPEDTIEIWDLRTRSQARVLPKSSAAINALRFAPDHTTLAAGDDLRAIRLWNVATGEQLMALEGETDRIDDLVFFPDQKRLVSVAVNSAIRIWHLPTQRQLLELHPPRSNATVPGNRLIVSPNGQQVIACLTTNHVQVYASGNSNVDAP